MKKEKQKEIKPKIKVFVIEKPDKEDWGLVNMTELDENGNWICGNNLITSIEDVVERSDKENVPIITRRYLEKQKNVLYK